MPVCCGDAFPAQFPWLLGQRSFFQCGPNLPLAKSERSRYDRQQSHNCGFNHAEVNAYHEWTEIRGIPCRVWCPISSSAACKFNAWYHTPSLFLIAIHPSATRRKSLCFPCKMRLRFPLIVNLNVMRPTAPRFLAFFKESVLWKAERQEEELHALGGHAVERLLGVFQRLCQLFCSQDVQNELESPPASPKYWILGGPQRSYGPSGYY